MQWNKHGYGGGPEGVGAFADREGSRMILDQQIVISWGAAARPRGGAAPFSGKEPSPEAIYGRALQSGWEERYREIEFLFRAEIPPWMNEPMPVVKGCIHRDPNSRNCLVNPDDYADMKLIDVGGFAADGGLVFDLALIETDAKLCLMATEKDSGGLFGLHSPKLKTWLRAEGHSLTADGSASGIAFDTESDPIRRDPSVDQAYRLIAEVRERAKELSGDWDRQGRHYFAALPYWTLNSLRFDTIRPTKKLLAIYTASEILRGFG